MSAIRAGELPAGALLERYAEADGERPAAYTDCYSAVARGEVPLTHYVETFYTTWLFRLERVILRFAVRRPSTDKEAAALACGEIDHFAAWSVEDRADKQLLMCDMHGATRSWFMTASEGTDTRLYFGSAVVPRKRRDGSWRLGSAYRWALPFHRLYSRALLSCARRALAARGRGDN